MRQLVRAGIVVISVLALFALAQAGILASLDRRLSDWRLAAANTPVTGTTVVVEIDSRSLAEIGVWPWPRSIYATLLDRLLDAGAEEVAFDIDFSSASAPFEDALFAAALERAGGYAWLAAFAQANADGSISFARPLPEFASSADPVLVNVLIDSVTGRAHSIPISATDDLGTIPALAVQLAGLASSLPPELEIDFSIELSTLTRVSVTDVLYGRLDPEMLAGKQVIVGASAIELRDFFNVPRFGIVPGPVLQAMALETLKGGRILANWGSVPALVAVALLAGMMLVRSRILIPATALALAAAAVVGEVAAFIAYAQADVIVSTGLLHIGLLLLLGLTLADNAYQHLQGRRAALDRLKYLATHDPATGRLSRQGLFELPDPAGPVALILLEVQAMDELRAMLGHDVVEHLLSRFARRLDHAGFPEVARTASHCFALLRADDGDIDRLATTARQLVTSLSGSHQVDEHSLHIDVVAGHASGATDRETLLSQAEIALIQARGDHTRTRGFSPEDQRALDRRRRLDRDLRQSINLNQLRLLYQPQVDLRTRRIVGAEALVRWDHPEFGAVSPAEFIPISEETGLIIELGRWALTQACHQAASWPSPVNVAVNVSPLQFQHSDVPALVRTALFQSGLPANRLELEITEGSRVTDPERIQQLMRSLEPLGVRLSIDDFGTGYSSLSYFRDLPFHTVKIDQGFIRGRTSKADIALLAAIIDLAHKMGKQTVAEGIEDEEAAALVTGMGCTFGQGYHFGRPMADGDLCALMGKNEQQRAS